MSWWRPLLWSFPTGTLAPRITKDYLNQIYFLIFVIKSKKCLAKHCSRSISWITINHWICLVSCDFNGAATPMTLYFLMPFRWIWVKGLLGFRGFSQLMESQCQLCLVNVCVSVVASLGYMKGPKIRSLTCKLTCMCQQFDTWQEKCFWSFHVERASRDRESCFGSVQVHHLKMRCRNLKVLVFPFFSVLKSVSTIMNQKNSPHWIYKYNGRSWNSGILVWTWMPSICLWFPASTN